MPACNVAAVLTCSSEACPPPVAAAAAGKYKGLQGKRWLVMACENKVGAWGAWAGPGALSAIAGTPVPFRTSRQHCSGMHLLALLCHISLTCFVTIH